MEIKHLGTYLNDHLAGSTLALELLERLSQTKGPVDVAGLAGTLHAEVSEDRGDLEALMARLEISQSRTRRVSAWAGEKLTQLKLHWDDPAGGALRILESIEAVSLGIEGKKGLWQALAFLSARAPELAGVDYQRLIDRATDQRSRLEPLRLEAARLALI